MIDPIKPSKLKQLQDTMLNVNGELPNKDLISTINPMPLGSTLRILNSSAQRIGDCSSHPNDLTLTRKSHFVSGLLANYAGTKSKTTSSSLNVRPTNNNTEEAGLSVIRHSDSNIGSIDITVEFTLENGEPRLELKGNKSATLHKPSNYTCAHDLQCCLDGHISYSTAYNHNVNNVGPLIIWHAHDNIIVHDNRILPNNNHLSIN